MQEVKPEVEKAVEPQKKVYEKDDFFDSLSCDALERLNIGAANGPSEKPQASRFFNCQACSSECSIDATLHRSQHANPLS